jgi:hypothetical protein
VRTKLDIYIFIAITSAGGLLVPGGIILTVVSVSTPTWLLDIFIIENYSNDYQNYDYPPWAQITLADFGYSI